MNSGFLGADV